MMFFHEVVHHLMHGELNCLIEVGIEAHGHVVLGSFSPRPFKLHVFSNNELKLSPQFGFNGGAVNFASALSRMPVANGKEGLLALDWDVQRSSGHQVFIVKVSSIVPRRSIADSPYHSRGGNSHSPKKWSQRNLHARSKDGNIAVPIQWNRAGSGIGELIGQCASTGMENVYCIVIGNANLKNAHFQNISGFCVLDRDRTDQNVPVALAPVLY